MPNAIMWTFFSTAAAAAVRAIFMFVLAGWLWTVVKTLSCKHLKKTWSILACGNPVSVSACIKTVNPGKAIAQACTLIPLSYHMGLVILIICCSMTAVRQWTLKAKQQVRLQSVSVLSAGHNISDFKSMYPARLAEITATETGVIMSCLVNRFLWSFADNKTTGNRKFLAWIRSKQFCHVTFWHFILEL